MYSAVRPSSCFAKQLPTAVNKRLNEISSDKQSFDNFKHDYEKALAESGLNHKLSYDPPLQDATEARTNMRNRKRNIIWFTPPYCAALKTNFGREFLKLIDKNFPVNNPLSKIINRKTIKLSYSCTENMHAIMQNHNRKILPESNAREDAKCNCQSKSSCPIPGKCCTAQVVYQAIVKHDDGRTAEYIGSTEPSFKLRCSNHKKSFKHEKYKSESTISKYLWENKINKSPNITWKFLKQCKTYSIGQKSCDLCLTEKHFIIKNLQQPNLINKRTDIGNKCIHKMKCTFQSAIT